ncbi:MAG: Gfo/Idh/MocA family oxidoreductase [Neomegalonema sp.]|nr:Gfo/Idh/MocA family oxidoreductase [Neomegalonema sp.]
MSAQASGAAQAYRVGVLGFSAGNGHPYSFSAILNGFEPAAFPAQWAGIRRYLEAREPEEFGLTCRGLPVRVTRVWCPERAEAEQIAAACRIEAVSAQPSDMLGAVDAVLILRDDWQSHLPLAMPFLAAGLPVFIDKPLTAEAAEYAQFEPYLARAQLMSCSGLRYARELDPLREGQERFGQIQLIRAAVINDWTRYGIHMLEAVMGALPIEPVSIQRLVSPHDSLAIQLEDGALLQIDALGGQIACFRIEIYAQARAGFPGLVESYVISDNFSAFRRTLTAFFAQIESGRPAIPVASTRAAMATLRAGLRATPGAQPVPI